MAKKYWVVSVISSLFILGIYLFNYINQAPPLYGDDQKSIKKVIQSMERYQDKPIKILKMKDMQENRLVGFLADRQPSYIQFTKNEEGHYEWEYSESAPGESLGLFLIRLRNEERTSDVKFMLVTTPENDIARMQVRVNGKQIEKEISPHEAGVSWLDLPPSEDGHTFRDYKFHDQNGQLVDR